MLPLVSVITAVYNKEKYVEETILSVLRQTYSRVEHILINDGSTDQSSRRIKKYANCLRYYEAEHKGGSWARNKGYERAAGDYLMFLDADDLITPETIEALVEAQQVSRGGKMITCCPWERMNKKSGEWIFSPGLSLQPPDNDYLLSWIKGGWFIPTCSVLWNRFAYEQTGPWDENLVCNQDGDMMIRAILKGVSLIPAQRGKGFYRTDEDKQSITAGAPTTLRLKSEIAVLEKTEKALKQSGRINDYKKALSIACYGVARRYVLEDPELAMMLLAKHKAYGGHQSRQTFWHRMASALVGLKRKEEISRWWRKLKK